MKDNLVQFPANAIKRLQPSDGAGAANEHELKALRDAFDEARKLWPLEMSELPEQNRKCAHSTKR